MNKKLQVYLALFFPVLIFLSSGLLVGQAEKSEVLAIAHGPYLQNITENYTGRCWEAWTKTKVQEVKMGVRNFTESDNHESRGFPTFGKSNTSSTDAKSFRIYVRSFKN